MKQELQNIKQQIESNVSQHIVASYSVSSPGDFHDANVSLFHCNLF